MHKKLGNEMLDKDDKDSSVEEISYLLSTSERLPEARARLLLALKKDQPMPVLCTLASNIVTHFEVSSTAALAKCFSPLKIFEVKGPKDFSTIIQHDRSQHTVRSK